MPKIVVYRRATIETLVMPMLPTKFRKETKKFLFLNYGNPKRIEYYPNSSSEMSRTVMIPTLIYQ